MADCKPTLGVVVLALTKLVTIADAPDELMQMTDATATAVQIGEGRLMTSMSVPGL